MFGHRGDKDRRDNTIRCHYSGNILAYLWSLVVLTVIDQQHWMVLWGCSFGVSLGFATCGLFMFRFVNSRIPTLSQKYVGCVYLMILARGSDSGCLNEANYSMLPRYISSCNRTQLQRKGIYLVWINRKRMKHRWFLLIWSRFLLQSTNLPASVGLVLNVCLFLAHDVLPNATHWGGTDAVGWLLW